MKERAPRGRRRAAPKAAADPPGGWSSADGAAEGADIYRFPAISTLCRSLLNERTFSIALLLRRISQL